MKPLDDFLREHEQLTRRHWLKLGATASALATLWPRSASAEPPAPELQQALAELESYFTTPSQFNDVSRGTPLPHSLPDDQKMAVGLTRESWRLEVISDPDNPVRLRKPMTKADGTAFDFNALLQLAEKHAVRFPKVMTCLNIGCPLGMGIWEGVPLRELIWLSGPADNLRRIFYYGFHNDDPKQMFQSSLPVGRVLEDPYDLPPVILCYKLNGEWLDSQRGGPVRIVVPEAYGFKSIKWLSHVVLTNLAHANDTYADNGNDVDSPLKTFCATLSVPKELKANEKIPVTGYAQVGMPGLSKVQVWISPSGENWPSEDPYFATAPWTDADLLAPPSQWGGDLPDGKIPDKTMGFDPATGQPLSWPLRFSKIHWAALLPGLDAGTYTLRCRTVDEKGIGQPLPRPFRKSGHSAIEMVTINVTA